MGHSQVDNHQSEHLSQLSAGCGFQLTVLGEPDNPAGLKQFATKVVIDVTSRLKDTHTHTHNI